MVFRKKKKSKQTKHKRIIQSITAVVERKILIWIASKTPPLVTPDMYTIVGVLASLIIFFSYVFARNNPIFLWLAACGFILNWLGDSMDGTLARYRKIERPRYGYFLDHSVDVISVALILTGIAFSGYVRLEIVYAAVVGYLLLTLYTAFAIYSTQEFKISYMHLGPTEIRIITIFATIWAFYDNSKSVQFPFGNFSVFELVLLVLSVLFNVVYIYTTIQQTIRLAKVDPPPSTYQATNNDK